MTSSYPVPDLRPASPGSHRRAPQLRHSIFALGATAVILGVGYGALKLSADVLLLLAACLVGTMGAAFGCTWREMQSGVIASTMRGMPSMLIVIVVGALIGSWMAAGIIPMIVYYGLGIVTPHYFLFTASLAAGILSMLTGTGFGTVGTIGVAFMGIGHGLGMPPGPTAGALVAGAYLGDKISPFAANANLAVAVSQAEIYEHITHCLWTTVPALAAGWLVYLVVGRPAGGAAMVTGFQLRNELAGHFVFGPWLLLPPLLTIVAMALRQPVIPSMMTSIIAALVLAILIQRTPVGTAARALTEGYVSRTGVPELDALLSRGGMLDMMRVTLIALAAFAYGGILQTAGLLEPLLAGLNRFARRPGRLVLTTGLACVAVAMLTGGAILSIMLPGELFAPAYSRLGLAGKNLSRTIADCGIVSVPLIPWSIAGAFISRTLGVPVTTYAPWAVFCYTGFLMTAIVGLTGWSLAREPRRGGEGALASSS
jgi:NhaC family Na+:H+ antiporter